MTSAVRDLTSQVPLGLSMSRNYLPKPSPPDHPAVSRISTSLRSIRRSVSINSLQTFKCQIRTERVCSPFTETVVQQNGIHSSILTIKRPHLVFIGEGVELKDIGQGVTSSGLVAEA